MNRAEAQRIAQSIDPDRLPYEEKDHPNQLIEIKWRNLKTTAHYSREEEKAPARLRARAAMDAIIVGLVADALATAID